MDGGFLFESCIPKWVLRLAPSSSFVSFFFKVSLSDESQCVRELWLCRDFVLPLLQTGCRFPVAGFTAAAPQMWEEHTLHQSVASASSSGTGSPRTVSLSLPTPGRSPIPCLCRFM